jgi:sugar phosphate isomerase/epimerase
MSREIIVVTAAYGRDEVKMGGGQANLLTMIKESGADGVEIRRELFSEQELKHLDEIGDKIRQLQLICYYSVPTPLFVAIGQLTPHYLQFQQEAKQLGARAIKFSLGAGPGELSTVEFTRMLEANIPILIENDQMPASSSTILASFFARHQNCPPLQGMTFDMANWHWIDESPELAAQKLGQYVRYIHVKAAVMDGGKLRAVPIATQSTLWQTLLETLPTKVAIGIEFPLIGADLGKVTQYYVQLLRGHVSKEKPISP